MNGVKIGRQYVSPWWMLGGLAIVGTAVAVHLDAWADIVGIALRDEEASHILLVPIVALWLVWVRRGRLRQCRFTPSVLGPLIMAAGWLISWFGLGSNNIQSFWHGGAVLVAIGALVTVAGGHVLLKFFPAFAVLVFLVPVPNMARQEIALPLQTATASVTAAVSDLIGIEVERNANVLTCNGVPVAIAEACNGMRMVFALVLVSYAFAFGTPLRHYARVLILAGSPLSAIACNVVRLVPTVWFYGYKPEDFAEKFHDISGWLMLPIAFLVLMGLIRLLRWALIPVTQYTLAYD